MQTTVTVVTPVVMEIRAPPVLMRRLPLPLFRAWLVVLVVYSLVHLLTTALLTQLARRSSNSRLTAGLRLWHPPRRRTGQYWQTRRSPASFGGLTTQHTVGGPRCATRALLIATVMPCKVAATGTSVAAVPGVAAEVAVAVAVAVAVGVAAEVAAVPGVAAEVVQSRGCNGVLTMVT